MKRKLISLLLTVCLFMTFLPSTALADIYIGEVGSAGENIIYEFSATTGLFYAHGTGDMWNFDITGHPAPWSDIKHLIKSVNIGQGINAIGSCTFNNCSNLQSVLIDSGVTEIGSGAFDNCSMLTNIELPNSIQKINRSAFRNCTGLTSIRLPESVTELRSMTFLGCTRLRNVNIPTSIKRIANNLFYECSSLSTIEIPVGVTDIGIAAFKGCASLDTVTIPEGVTKMQWNAFYDCTGLKAVYLPVSLTTIEYDAFSNCYSLSDVYYAGSESQWNNISTNGTIFGGSNPTIHFAIEDPTPQQYTVSFYPNGGIVGTVSKTVTNGESYGNLPTPLEVDIIFSDGLRLPAAVHKLPVIQQWT
ncbi:leucine-rich repeat protein [Oscillospiraceae bacterium 42-9]